jgi:hypothetical protein
MRIFLDANILFSASLSGSATRILFNAALEYCDECITNYHVLEEAKRNIENKRPNQMKVFNTLIKRIKPSNRFYSTLTVNLPSQDVPVLAGAIGSRCTHLWTGDKKHFGALYNKTIHGVLIVSHIILADILCDMGWKPNI